MFSKQLEAFSLSEWITILLTTFLGFVVLRVFVLRRKNLPPGPIGFPFVGYLPYMIYDRRPPHEKLQELASKYDDIMSVNMGGKTCVFLSSNAAIREVFVGKGYEVAGRPQMMFSKEPQVKSLGVVQSEGETWKIHRRFALQTLRDFGFGKLSLESRIHEIAKDLIKELENSQEKPIEVKELLCNSTANVISSLVFDKHFKIDDPVFQKLIKNLNKLLTLSSVKRFFSASPFLRFLQPLQRSSSAPNGLEIMRTLTNIIADLIQEHRETFDPAFLRDYVDVYLDEMRAKETYEDADNSTFTVNRLIAVASDLFNAGTETTSNTIHWALRFLMLYPEIQSKLQTEIDEVVGRERFPSVMDRPKMPYTEATINEVLRISSLLPLGVFHSNAEEVKIRDYIIPKRSVIVANFWAVHHDSKYWPNPEKFDPTRFLSASGKLEKKDNFYPFSAGKRFCLGETLARTELFIFLTSILQQFTITPSDGDSDRSLKINQSGIITTLEPFKLCARKRALNECQ